MRRRLLCNIAVLEEEAYIIKCAYLVHYKWSKIRRIAQ